MRFTLRILQSTLFVTALMNAMLLLLFVQSSFANSDGRRTARTILNGINCGGGACHGTTTPNTAVRLWAFANNQRITDSIVVMPGARVRLTVMVAHSNSGAGINVAVRAGLTGEVSVGTVTPADNSIAVRGTAPSTELTQTQTKGKAQGDSAIAFSFDWQAPTATGTYFLRAIGNAVNNNGGADAGDVWNWLQPVRLVVASVVSVQSPAEGLGQFDVAPNPVSGSSTFSWTLPTGTDFANALNEEYTLRLVNAAGVELRSWQGFAVGGRVVIPFDGNDQQGIALSSGQYFAILQTRQRRLIRTVAILR